MTFLRGGEPQLCAWHSLGRVIISGTSGTRKQVKTFLRGCHPYAPRTHKMPNTRSYWDAAYTACDSPNTSRRIGMLLSRPWSVKPPIIYRCSMWALQRCEVYALVAHNFCIINEHPFRIALMLIPFRLAGSCRLGCITRRPVEDSHPSAATAKSTLRAGQGDRRR